MKATSPPKSFQTTANQTSKPRYIHTELTKTAPNTYTTIPVTTDNHIAKLYQLIYPNSCKIAHV